METVWHFNTIFHYQKSNSDATKTTSTTTATTTTTTTATTIVITTNNDKYEEVWSSRAIESLDNLDLRVAGMIGNSLF